MGRNCDGTKLEAQWGIGEGEAAALIGDHGLPLPCPAPQSSACKRTERLPHPASSAGTTVGLVVSTMRGEAVDNPAECREVRHVRGTPRSKISLRPLNGYLNSSAMTVSPSVPLPVG